MLLSNQAFGPDCVTIILPHKIHTGYNSFWMSQKMFKSFCCFSVSLCMLWFFIFRLVYFVIFGAINLTLEHFSERKNEPKSFGFTVSSRNYLRHIIYMFIVYSMIKVNAKKRHCTAIGEAVLRVKRKHQ